MNVLLLAPHPFFQDRGTPIAVDLLVRTLAARGENIDVLTYHEGEARSYNGPGRVVIHRIAAPPGCRNIRPGFSPKKLVADLWMYRKAKQLCQANTYDVIHAVEEAAFMALRLGKKHGIPYIFDMDSSMPIQMADKLPVLKPVLGVMHVIEARAIREAAAVAAVCDALADIARNAGAQNVAILRDVPLLDQYGDQNGQGFRDQLNVTGCALLYIGNLEPYQGIDLLIESFARVPSELGAHLVIVGGNPGHVQHYRERTSRLSLDGRCHILGPRPLSDMRTLMAEADVLLSPRTQGNNTPMKIYSYMASGKPIVATELPTHTQVLNRETAMLSAPEPAAFATALERVIRDADLRTRIGARAKEVVERDYSLTVFEATLNKLYDSLQPTGHDTGAAT